MKFRDILKSASSNLWRSKGRTILTMVAIFIGALTISLTMGVNIGVNHYIEKQMGSIGGEDLLLISQNQAGSVQSQEEGADKDAPTLYNPEKSSSYEANFLTATDLKKIEKMEGIKSVEPFVGLMPDYIEGASGKKYDLSLSALDGLDLDLKAGKTVATSGDAYEIAIMPNYVKALGYASPEEAIGKTIKIAVTAQITGQQEIVEAKIVGVRNESIVQTGQAIASKGLADKVVAISETEMPAALKNQYQGAQAVMTAAYVKDQSKIADLKERLTKEGYNGLTVEDELGTIRQVVNAITGVLTMFGAIALLAASFGIINTLYMSVQDRTREIGLMKAMGASSGKIFLGFTLEALLIGFWGSALGVVCAMGLGQIINNYASGAFLSGLTGLHLLEFSWLPMLTIILIIMGIAFLAGTFPANKAARMDPIQSLKYE